MARKNDLEVSPAQEAEDVQRVRARVESRSRTGDRDEADTGENIGAFSGSDDDDAGHNGKIDTGGRPDELDSDDAEDLAELINGASLSGANVPSSKPADKISEGKFSRTINSVIGYITGSSQKPAELLRGNNSPTSQLSKSQKQVKQSRDPPQEVPDKSAALGGDKSTQGKTLARPNTIYEDISKMQKPRRSGRPDPYDVPQSPTRSPAPESKSTVPKRQGPKPKRSIIKGKPQQVPEAPEENPGSIEGELVEPQERLEHTEMVRSLPQKAIPAGGERNVGPNRATRSTRPTAPDDLEEFQRQRKQYQRKVIKESRDHVQTSSPTQSLASKGKGQPGDQDGGNQIGLPAADLAELQNDVQVLSSTKTQSKTKSTMSGRRGPQFIKNIPVTPTKPHFEPEKGPAQNSAQIELNGISPILSGPTPAKEGHDLSRRLKRPSLLPRPAQGCNPSTQQLTKIHSVKNSVIVQIPGSAHSEASDSEDNTQLEVNVSTAPTPKIPASSKDDATSFIDEEILKKLRSTIQMAGEKEEERMVKKIIYWTSNGKDLTRWVMRLIARYKTMKDLRSANVVDVDRIDNEHKEVLKCLDTIYEKSQNVLTCRLGDPDSGGRNADKDSRSHMLEDLYIYVIPGIVEALDCAVHSWPDQKALEISDLEEIYAILKILYDLVEASRNEDKTIQPKAPKTKSYAIFQLTRILRPIIKKLFIECGKKISGRKMAIKAEQIRQAMPNRARKRKERLEDEQRKEDEQFQQRLRERNKAIIASLDERRAELGLPPCSQSMEAPSTSQQRQTPKYMAEGPFDGADRDTNGRLFGVFGSRQQNSHPGTKPKEWTVDEMEILIDGLRRNRGPTRYEKLAPKLDRTLDEIFDRAKYLKMQMEYTLKRLQEENPNKEFPPIKPWIENIGSEGFLDQ